jgi:hypothetical protein
MRLDGPTHHSGNLDLAADNLELQHQEEFGRARAVPIARVVDCPDGGNLCPGNGSRPKPPARYHLVSDNDHTNAQAPERKQYRDADEQKSRPKGSLGGSIDGVEDPAQSHGSEHEQKQD